MEREGGSVSLERRYAVRGASDTGAPSGQAPDVRIKQWVKQQGQRQEGEKEEASM